MEKDQETVSRSGGMERKNKEVFFIPSSEKKDFYLKLAFFTDPHACVPVRSEYELLRILDRNLKKIVKALSLMNNQQWGECIPKIEACYGHYLMQNSISKKERSEVYLQVGQHLSFLSRMTANTTAISQLFDMYRDYSTDVERLLEQYTEEEHTSEGDKCP